MVTQKALRAVAPSLRQLAEDEGLPYTTLKAWSAGVRSPEAGSVDKLTALLRRRAAKLEKLAAELDRLTTVEG
jgi:hypothetical protein